MLITPEFACFILDRKPGPKIIGWTFQVNKLGVYYAQNTNGNDYVCIDRDKAQVYSDLDVMTVSRNAWNWGRKTQGRWRAVYEQA